MNFGVHRVWRTFGLILAVLVCLAVWGMNIYAEREQRFRHQVETSVKTTSELTVRSMVQWRGRLQASANALSDDQLLARAVHAWMQDPSESNTSPLADRLRSLVERGEFTKVALTNLQGQVLLRSGGSSSVLPEREYAAMQTAMETASAVFVEPYDNANFAYPSLSLIAPLFDGDESVGAIWLIVDLRATLFPLLDLWRAGSVSAESILLQREGDAIYHINPLRHNGAGALAKFADFTDLQFVAVKAFHGVRGVVYDKDYRHHAVLAVVGVIPDSPWILVSKIDEREAFSMQQRNDGLLLGLSVGGLVLALCCAALYRIWSLVQQERQLKTQLQRNMRWLERAQKTASIGHFSIDLKKRQVILSPMAGNILGFSGEKQLSFKKLKSMLHARDIEDLLREQIKNLVRSESFQGDFRVFPENSVRSKWLEVCCEYEGENHEKKIIGTLQDISLRKKVEEELASYRRSLEVQVRQDALTGLANRFALDEAVHHEWLRTRRSGQVLSVLMIDIDYFKGYNDFYGHLQGDECLKNVGRKILATVSRVEDVVARYGGEEFAVLLPNTAEENALMIAKKLCQAVEKMQLEHLASPAYKVVTISIGVSSISPVFIKNVEDQEHSVRQLFEQADHALYQAKNLGRNRAVVFDPHAQRQLAVLSH
jgi:diguanylate cyclase (GGDEF)-like protein